MVQTTAFCASLLITPGIGRALGALLEQKRFPRLWAQCTGPAPAVVLYHLPDPWAATSDFVLFPAQTENAVLQF